MKPPADVRRRVLVTGATGFLGQRLVPRLLDHGCSVTAVGLRQQSSPFSQDVRFLCLDLAAVGTAAAEGTAAALDGASFDAIINLAGPVPTGAQDWGQGSATLSWHIAIAAAVRMNIPHGWTGRLIHASSMTVYGAPEALRVEEDHPRAPGHLYALGKSVAEDLMLSGDPALDCWILRLPGLFSESRRSGALFHFMRAAAQGETIRLTPTTATPWDILHVDDAAEAFIHALDAPTRRAGAVNIGYGEPMNLSSVAEWIAVHAAKGSRVVNEGGVEHPVFALGIGKAELLLNWRPPELSSRLDALYVSWNAGFC